MDSEGILRELADKRAIEELIYRYCVAVDSHDHKSLKEMYHPDARDDHGSFGNGTVDHFLSFVEQNEKNRTVATVHHNTTNVLIRLDGDYAEAISWGIAFHVVPDANGTMTDYVHIGRFLDKFEKRGGTWKFLHRRPVIDMGYRSERSRMSLDDPFASGLFRGTNGPDDPAYDFFRLFRRGEI